MSQGHFIVTGKRLLSEVAVGEQLGTSDFATMTPDGLFVQMKFIEEDANKSQGYPVKPGVYTIVVRNNQFVLETTSFVKDSVLDSFVSTKEITDKIDRFFKRLDVYYKYGFEVPKRGVLLYGPPGGGKSTAVSKVVQGYSKDEETAVVVWHTDKFEAHHIKDFIKRFEYDGVKKLILVVEDIGGVEIDQVKMKSDSSLLSLLDNQEKTFTIPVLIMATTNFPEVFMGNLTNRPNRFDDKIEVGYPSGEARVSLFNFFLKNDKTSTDALELLKSKETEKFSPAHIREVVIRSAIYEKSHSEVIRDMVEEIKLYEKAFEKNVRKLGLRETSY